MTTDDQAEAAAVELIHDVVAVLGKPAKSRDSAYQMVNLCAEVQARYGDLDGARERYTKAVQRPDLDWPEAVFEAFTNFENVHGSLETFVAARKQIAVAQKKLNRRREREAQAQQAQQAAYAQQQAEAMAAAAPVEAAEPQAEVVEAMEVDGVAPAAVTEAAPAAETSAAASAPAAPAAPTEKEGEGHVKRYVIPAANC